MVPSLTDKQVTQAYELAKEVYALYGVDVEEALAALRGIPVSIHCWQGDDVAGFEAVDAAAGGGIQATGNYPGRARNAEELRQDLEQALRLIPGKHRLNLHAMYAETGGKRVDRDALAPAHFTGWFDWCKAHGLGMDFNPTCFAHPKADDGFTLAHYDKGVRDFWIAHCQACRVIGGAAGEALGTPCVTNVWIPDGYKDVPADRRAHRELLKQSLDHVFEKPVAHNLDAVESKLFGIGSESYVVGSHEFYLGYAVAHQKLYCLDAGHFHPTESIADKISSCLTYLPELLLHVSRGVRWDSDHVVLLTDDLRAIAEELVRHKYLDRVHIGLDFFDASINRVAAWVIGTRAMLKALLIALLEPFKEMRQLEAHGDFTARLALVEETKMLPAEAVWNYYCMQQETPPAMGWLKDVQRYEQDVLSKRG